MSGVKEIVTFFCAVSVMCGAFNLLSGKTLNKSFKYILALIFLCVIVSSFTKADFKIILPKSTTTAATSESVIAMSEYEAEYLIRALLDESQIKYTKIKAYANKLEDGGIVINEIVLSGVTEKEKARALILNSKVTKTVKFE